MDTYGKRKEHGAYPERHTAKNYTRQRNNSEHGETKTHGKEVDTWPA
jgi:hypothetical protein